MRLRSGLFMAGGAALVVLMLVIWIAGLAPYQFRGVQIDPPVPAPRFQLIDQDGGVFDLEDQRGSLLLISFGYTNCPDVCPVTLTKYKRIRQELGSRAGEVRFLMVTVDPERDSPQRLKTYLNGFDAEFIGLTGTQAEMEPVWASFNVYRQMRDQGSAAGYQLDHTSITYLIDRAGNWRLTYPFEMDSEALVADLRHLLQEDVQ